MKLNVRQDRRLIRSTERSQRFCLVEITAPTAQPKEPRQPVNLTFVLDRSGSMSGQKIALARQAIEAAIGRLHPHDRFAVVVYDDKIEVVIESTTGSPEARRSAVDRLQDIGARGSTDLAGGWLRGAEQVARHLGGHATNRVLLMTDGLANVGITDPAELERHARELRARGVTTSTFGVGDDFDDRLLQAIADAGGGHFYYIEHAAQIGDHLSGEVGEVLATVARAVTVAITVPEHVDLDSLSAYKLDRRGSRASVHLGDLVSGQSIEVVLELGFPTGKVGGDVGALFTVIDPAGETPPEPERVTWTYADDAMNDAQPRDRVVDRAVAHLLAARARVEAVRLQRLDDYQSAGQVIRAAAQRIGASAGDDPDLRAYAATLLAEETGWAAPAPEPTLKQAFATASYALRGRDPAGRAARRR